MVVSSLLITGLTFHHFALMTSSGLTTSQAAAIFIPQIAGTIGAGFIWAWLSDKVSARFLLITCQFSLAAAHISYIWVSPGFTAAFYSLLLGVNGGSIRALTSVLYPKWFGTANIGAIRGVATAFGVGASAMGPLVIAVGFNLTASYNRLNALLSIVPACAMIAAAFIVPPKSPKERISSGPHR
jgi:MFS family permease